MSGDGQNQRKISAPHPMTETYRLISLLIALILLDSPFKRAILSKGAKPILPRPNLAGAYPYSWPAC
jgi:hypothetical protein